MDNPVYFIDPDGMKVSYGAFIDNAGHKSVSEQQDEAAAASMETTVANASKSSGDAPPNDITVNSSGIVTNVDINDKPHRVFDENGKQLSINDYENDSQWLGMLSEGDRFYHNIDELAFLRMILNAGVKFRGGLGGYYNIAWQSHFGGGDFGARQIAGEFDIPYDKTEYSNAGAGDGSFFRFGSQKTLYNLADAGNFMWGSWMRGNNLLYIEAKAGSQINNFFSNLFSIERTNGWKDSNADQQAIKAGYYYTDNLLSSWRK